MEIPEVSWIQESQELENGGSWLIVSIDGNNRQKNGDYAIGWVDRVGDCEGVEENRVNQERAG